MKVSARKLGGILMGKGSEVGSRRKSKERGRGRVARQGEHRTVMEKRGMGLPPRVQAGVSGGGGGTKHREGQLPSFRELP